METDFLSTIKDSDRSVIVGVFAKHFANYD